MSGETYNVIHGGQGVPIKAWTKGVQLEDQAKSQLLDRRPSDKNPGVGHGH
jgi:hypothetical protein